jgi:hypothetical protein
MDVAANTSAMDARLRQLQAGARKRTDKSYDLPLGFTALLFERQGGRCAVTGISFSLEEYPHALVKHPFAPSLDRMDSKVGYTASNVRLVCVAVNFGMNQWGEEVFMRLARAAVEYQTEPKPGSDAEWFARQLGRIASAEKELATLSSAQQPKQRQRIAGLKAALAKGPERLREIARRAADTSRSRRVAQQAPI